MSDRISKEHLDRPFDIGDLVHSKGDLKHDRLYTLDAVEDRHKYAGAIGMVKSLHNSHGLSCTVEFGDGGEAVYEDSELTLFAPCHELVAVLWKEREIAGMRTRGTLTMEDAEIIAIRWAAMAEEGTMHIRALRNLIRQQAGLERIPDEQPLETLTT